MDAAGATRGPPRDLLAAVGVAIIATLLQLATSNLGGYFRDELYYLACAQHLALGYVDHPPLIAWITALVRSTLGDSLFALRLLPALAAGGTIFLCGFLAREMGGGRTAVVVAAVSAAFAPVYVSLFGFLSMNAFDLLLTAASASVLVRLLRTGDLRWWVAFGAIAGLGLENKLSMLFWCGAVVAGLAVTADFRHFASRWFWIGMALAVALLVPHLVWQHANGWPTVEFMENAARQKNLPMSALAFLGQQLLLMNPLAAPLWGGGLLYLLLGREARSFRALAIAYVALVVLFVAMNGKAYYLAPAYPALLAAGGIGVERLSTGAYLRWLGIGIPALIVASGIALAPLAKPLLPVETFVTYRDVLGIGPEATRTEKDGGSGRLPQHLADRNGWPQMVRAVAAVWRALPAPDGARACILASNYGEAGAIDFFGPALGLPAAISGHNSYWLWGPGDCDGSTVIVLGRRKEDLDAACNDVRLADRIRCLDCEPHEDDLPIWVCSGLRKPLPEIWAELKTFL